MHFFSFRIFVTTFCFFVLQFRSYLNHRCSVAQDSNFYETGISKCFNKLINNKLGHWQFLVCHFSRGNFQILKNLRTDYYLFGNTVLTSSRYSILILRKQKYNLIKICIFNINDGPLNYITTKNVKQSLTNMCNQKLKLKRDFTCKASRSPFSMARDIALLESGISNVTDNNTINSPPKKNQPVLYMASKLWNSIHKQITNENREIPTTSVSQDVVVSLWT